MFTDYMDRISQIIGVAAISVRRSSLLEHQDQFVQLITPRLSNRRASVRYAEIRPNR